MATGFFWAERCMWHDNGSAVGVLPPMGVLQPGQHVEEPETKRRLKNLLDGYGVTEKMVRLEPARLEDADILAVHTERYLQLVKDLSASNGGDAGEFAMVGQGSFEIATLAAAGVAGAVDAVLAGQCDNGYALTRPPGHHAEPDIGRGFCLFSNIGIAIRRAQARGAVGKVAVVDWDVHHGNGTEAVFYDDPEVLTVSLHQDGLYPFDTGGVNDLGRGAGEGVNVNIPLPPGCGSGAYDFALSRVVAPALERFRPELIVVACGFDAALADPLGRMLLTPRQFGKMTSAMKELADRLCGGRLAMAHEGGYSAFLAPFCGLAVIETLLGQTFGAPDPFSELYEAAPGQELQPHQKAAIEAVARIHSL